LSPFEGWPVLNGPPLQGARVTLTNDQTTLTAATGPDGSFTLAEAPPGTYSLRAEMPPLVPVLPRTTLRVPEAGCGSQDFALRTESELRGVVVDHNGRPVRGVPVDVEVIGTSAEYPVSIGGRSDTAGRFAIVGVPGGGVRLSYGSEYPSSEMPYS